MSPATAALPSSTSNASACKPIRTSNFFDEHSGGLKELAKLRGHVQQELGHHGPFCDVSSWDLLYLKTPEQPGPASCGVCVLIMTGLMRGGALPVEQAVRRPASRRPTVRRRNGGFHEKIKVDDALHHYSENRVRLPSHEATKTAESNHVRGHDSEAVTQLQKMA